MNPIIFWVLLIVAPRRLFRLVFRVPDYNGREAATGTFNYRLGKLAREVHQSSGQRRVEALEQFNQVHLLARRLGVGGIGNTVADYTPDLRRNVLRERVRQATRRHDG